MQVGHFWLTGGLAFTPLHGSALYMDVRLVTHCSDTCTVLNGKSSLEGRYGELTQLPARWCILVGLC